MNIIKRLRSGKNTPKDDQQGHTKTASSYNMKILSTKTIIPYTKISSSLNHITDISDAGILVIFPSFLFDNESYYKNEKNIHTNFNPSFSQKVYITSGSDDVRTLSTISPISPEYKCPLRPKTIRSKNNFRNDTGKTIQQGATTGSHHALFADESFKYIPYNIIADNIPANIINYI